MPLKDAIAALASTVLEESRKDIHLDAKEIAQAINVSNNQFTIGSLRVGEHALRGLTSRLASPVTAYALGLQERSFSNASSSVQKNDDLVMMAEVLRYECLRNPGVEFKLRTREARNDIYAILSPTFGVADAPAVMDQILDAMPTDAKGTWSYNPETTRWELRAEIWTPTPVAEHSVGEVINGFISMSARDNGTGRFKGGGGIICLRCLNASVYSAGETLSRVHRGNKVMFDVANMIQKSKKAIDALCVAWGKAREDEIAVPTGLTLEQAIPGLFRSLLKEGDLVGVLPGKKETHVAGLTYAYRDQRRDSEKLVRSDIAQGWTSYIKGQTEEVRAEAEEAIGGWIVSPPRTFKFDMKEKD